MKTAIEATTHTIAATGRRRSRTTSGKGRRPARLRCCSSVRRWAPAGFVTLASHFADRTVVTYDPRGVERSKKDDADCRVDARPARGRRASGDRRLGRRAGRCVRQQWWRGRGAGAGAARYPDDVRTVVAHEPPIATVLPDREAALAANRDIHDTYLKSRVWGQAWPSSSCWSVSKVEIPADYTSRPAPDPQMFGLPTEDDGKRDDPLLGRTCSRLGYQPDFDALRAAPTRS